MAALAQALAQAGADTASGAAVGEAGVGKSRLLYEFVHWRDCVDAGRSPFPRLCRRRGTVFNVPLPSAQGWLILESASVSYGKPLPTFRSRLLKRYVHIEDGDEPRTVRRKSPAPPDSGRSVAGHHPALLAL